MREPENTNSEGNINVVVGLFGSDPQNLTLPVDSSVGYALEQAGIVMGDNMTIYVNGTKATTEGLLDSGDVVNVVTSKEGGV